MEYDNKISHIIRDLPRSGIRDFFELVIGRTDVISLGVGEPDKPTPWPIREAVIRSLEKGQTSYTSNLGLESLRIGISEYVTKHFRTTYDPKTEILVTVGVSEALDIAFRAVLNPGDEVIYHEPCYVSYSPSIKMAYGVPVVVQTREENEFALMAEDVEKAITPRTKVIALNFPTNPTGGIMPHEELAKIAALAVKHDLLVFTDEIYSELLYDGRQHKSIVEFPGMRERTILLHGFSKAFAMTGWRLGYACAPAPLREAMMKIHQYCMLCAPIMSQMAGIEALKMGETAYEDMRQSYEQRRNLIVSRLNGMGLHCFNPGGAFYVFPEIRSTGLSSKDFAIQLLEKKSVAVVPGSAFSSAGEGFVRCCYATAPELIAKAMDLMEEFVNEVRAKK
ncbi:MAG: aminotransferase class I/II-fold pyridoxal phosphate-dependent enzyme [Prosthecobacter sp.]|uniref:pyridoxal phosphate-dependent aminotransferase n=1 Tax=Prosthecobacter sp. TaxID=1965333 RepID=UPI0025E6FAE0|nr:aminotransferase class I/II-fold pyridoxal phosphate-dependent enzyme [Prosthecobacter sp.]MCF7787589.1 aminotransferase class I/II-fold pyridoxal phosphate-dependent enzyme [Prosthecobacter sp.]